MYLVTFRPWECENSCPVLVRRVVRARQLLFSGDLNFQNFDYWLEFVRFYVWNEIFSHSWKKTQHEPSGHRNPSLQFLLNIDLIYWTHHSLFVSAAARDGGARRCVRARSVRSVSIVRAPLLFRSRSVVFSGEIGSPLFAQPSVQIRNVIRNSSLDNKRRPLAGFGWATLGRIILFCTSLSLSLNG